MEDIVRVLRVIEYVGPRRRVEEVVSRSIHGTRRFAPDFTIRAATIGEFPEIIERSSDNAAKAEAPDAAAESASDRHEGLT